jgi:hypothetical protein
MSQDVAIGYEDPGREGIREITPGVTSYSFYIDLDASS